MPFIDPTTMQTAEPLPGWKGRFWRSGAMSFAHYDVGTGCSIHEHHHANEEVWLILEGRFEVTVGGETPGLWRVASGFLVVGLAAGASADVRFARRADSLVWTPFDRVFRALIVVFGVAAIVAQVLNIFGAIERPFAPYLGGLVFFLFFSSVMFVRLVTIQSNGAERTSPERP